LVRREEKNIFSLRREEKNIIFGENRKSRIFFGEKRRVVLVRRIFQGKRLLTSIFLMKVIVFFFVTVVFSRNKNKVTITTSSKGYLIGKKT
jgi:hypothetical protein